MAFNVEKFKANLPLGGARPTLFNVEISSAPVRGLERAPFLVRTAQIPQSTIGQMIMPYFGRQIKFAGDRQFVDWTVTVINDEDFQIRNALESWHQQINGLETNRRTRNDFKGEARVIQYAKDGKVLREYTFRGLWPLDVSPIELDWEAQDQFEQFSVTWAYDYFEITGGSTGRAQAEAGSTPRIRL